MTQFDRAVVLITGAAGGFGQELTRQLLMAGSRLILTDLDLDLLRSRTAAIQQTVTTGEVLAYLVADLAEASECDRLYYQVKSLGYSVDILINNAGIALFGRMDEVPVEKWTQLMQVNLLAPMRLSSLWAGEMIARRRGHIVNISSVSGWYAAAGLTHYSTSKFGLRGFSEGLFNEVKAHNVKVTAVYPFFSRTPMIKPQKYGTLAEKDSPDPEKMATDPADVMRTTLWGIQRNQLHVFPDRTAWLIHLIYRISPSLLDWIVGTTGDPTTSKL